MISIFKILIAMTLLNMPLFSHCQIPCGIYSDAMQIIQIREDLNTIEKAMEMIDNLSGKSDPQTLNQIGRWITAKEQHAQNIQNLTSEYFLTQRIKTNSDNYSEKVILLHKLLVSTMKCKQSVDKNNVSISNSILSSFIKLYFDKHGIDHLKSLSIE